jgi:hypothetical protein
VLWYSVHLPTVTQPWGVSLLTDLSFGHPGIILKFVTVLRKFTSQLKKEFMLLYRSDIWSVFWLTCPADGCQGRSRPVTTNLHFTELIYFITRNSVTVAEATNAGSHESLDIIYLNWVDDLNKTVGVPSESFPLPALPTDSPTATQCVRMWNCHTRSSGVLLGLTENTGTSVSQSDSLKSNSRKRKLGTDRGLLPSTFSLYIEPTGSYETFVHFALS